MSTALIGLGSNLGDREANLNGAIERLQKTPGITDVVASSYHASKPIGGPGGQAEFLNGAARLETSLSPQQLFAELQRIENELGRVRTERWGPRTIDLDILLFDDVNIETPELTIPHPRFAVRRFALEPAAEVAPNMLHPALEMSVDRLVKYWRNSPRYVAITGPESAEYAQMVAGRFHARWLHSESAEHSKRDDEALLKEAVEAGARMLAKDSWPAGEQLAVSDFLFDELHARLRALSKEDFKAWLYKALLYRDSLVAPRLVVVTQYGTAAFDESCLGLLEFEHRQPILVLDISNRAAAQAELLAVIEASL